MTHLEPGSLNLSDGVATSGMSVDEVWLRQISVGGAAASIEVEAYLLGLLQPSRYQHDVLAQAINEHFIALGGDHPVAYSDGHADI
jgi:hypothetical protein